MEQFDFNKLSDDEKLLMLKYMPIKERVRFERINTIWGHLLDRLWLSQKRIGFYLYWNHIGEINPCHPFDFIDQYYTGNTVTLISAKAMLKVISRCNNLVALGITSKEFKQLNVATQLATVLNDSCKKLVHLTIPFVNMVFFELFTPSDKFSCILPSLCDRLKLLYDKTSPAQLLALRMIHYGRYEFNPMTLNYLNKLTVEHYDVRAWAEIIGELTNLRSVDMIIGDSANFHKLEHFSCSWISDTVLRRLFENNRKLVSLKIAYGGEKRIDIIIALGLNLKKLNIVFEKVAVFNDYKFWVNLAKLTKLRALHVKAQEFVRIDGQLIDGVLLLPVVAVVDMKLNVNGLIWLLETCTKLKNFTLFCHSNAEDITSEGEKEQIRTVVTNKSFKQSFAVSFGSSSSSLLIRVNIG